MSQIGHLVTAIVEVAAANGVEQLVTFGPRGFDGHRDHVAVFQAARRAVKELNIRLLVRLDANQIDKIDKADLILTGDRQLKIKACAITSAIRPRDRPGDVRTSSSTTGSSNS